MQKRGPHFDFLMESSLRCFSVQDSIRLIRVHKKKPSSFLYPLENVLAYDENKTNSNGIESNYDIFKMLQIILIDLLLNFVDNIIILSKALFFHPKESGLLSCKYLQ